MTAVVIIDSGGANTGSVRYALERIGARPLISTDPKVIREGERLILPGVGAAAASMDRLKKLGLDEVIPTLTQPLLGVCLGMQLLGRSSQEGEVECLGIADFETRRLQHPRVPHMGWNRLKVKEETPLLEGLDGEYFYFVHNYAVPRFEETTATASYGEIFSAAFSSKNFHAVQFHPERSSRAGSRLLENFLSI